MKQAAPVAYFETIKYTQHSGETFAPFQSSAIDGGLKLSQI